MNEHEALLKSASIVLAEVFKDEAEEWINSLNDLGAAYLREEAMAKRSPEAKGEATPLPSAPPQGESNER